jgi:HPr kinase/phosphorylase
LSYTPFLNNEVLNKKSFLVKDFFSHYKKQFQFTLRTPKSTLSAKIQEASLHRPGLALTGFTDVFSYQRVQIIGSTEWSYLESVGEDKRKECFTKLAQFETPLWVLTHGLEPHQEMVEMCIEKNEPLLVTAKPTMEFMADLQDLLDEYFAPYMPVHASLVDVYGVGMLYVGDSNIGKSECVLDLVERGHRFVADDMVRLSKKGNSIVGRSNHVINHHMEIRGIGIIDIKTMFGIHAVRKIKKVEIVVQLQHWQKDVKYERMGLDQTHIDIMGVSTPRVVIPITPGKNLTVISEVVAMNALMKMNGIDTAAEFNKNLIQIISRKGHSTSPEIFLDSSDQDEGNMAESYYE